MFPLGKRTTKLVGTAEKPDSGGRRNEQSYIAKGVPRHKYPRAPSRIDLIADACETCAYIASQGPRPSARL